MTNYRIAEGKDRPSLGGMRSGGIITYDYYTAEFSQEENLWILTIIDAFSFSEAKSKTNRRNLIARSRHCSKSISEVYINSKWRNIAELR